jgi:hypothetical protein
MDGPALDRTSPMPVGWTTGEAKQDVATPLDSFRQPAKYRLNGTVDLGHQRLAFVWQI